MKPAFILLLKIGILKSFEQLKAKQLIDDELETLMKDALKAYDEEFKDTIKS